MPRRIQMLGRQCPQDKRLPIGDREGAGGSRRMVLFLRYLRSLSEPRHAPGALASVRYDG